MHSELEFRSLSGKSELFDALSAVILKSERFVLGLGASVHYSEIDVFLLSLLHGLYAK